MLQISNPSVSLELFLGAIGIAVFATAIITAFILRGYLSGKKMQ